ncbi:WD repeat-containing protein 74-like [Corythoichthys intestinalis]|uniref:WD repeat-containing protein 74-like n=1 Tax=Corythoichthys intestinalis TaxID=161448 RepID=UPI0025A4F99B|nr:WD repeat-containing protein 74-like [Corythoichthys intestinalis]XP_061796925.1 WD repeat-containing protein 74-like [Nerophis lumbriciformis]
MGDSSRPCTVWLGSETGILKGVSVSRRQALNFCHSSQLSRQHEVRTLCWADAAESELLVGGVDGTVKTFSVEKGTFTDVRQCGDPSDGSFVGLATLDGGAALVTCLGGGVLRVWRDESGEPAAEIRVGNDIARMRQNPEHRHKVATGGKENCLKVWDLEKPDKPVFTARNLRNDWLNLRQPHWVMDMAFIPGSDKVVTCTGYHQVHVYDPSTPQRRPVLEATYGEYPLTTLSLPAAGGSVVVGNTHGQIAVLDLRKGLVRGCFKGLSGGVRGLQCHASQPVVASCGLDRFLRIHSLEDRRLQHKVYLKSRLNCLLLASRPLEEAGDDCLEVKEEDDEVWDAMEQVEEGEENPKRKMSEETSVEQENSKNGILKEGENFINEITDGQEEKTPESEEREPPKKQKRRKKAKA